MPPDAFIDGLQVSLSGIRSWYRFGIAHRLDGPAVETPAGELEWWVDGRQLHSDTLDELYRDGDQLGVEAVLRAWRPGGPTVNDLVEAVRVALVA